MKEVLELRNEFHDVWLFIEMLLTVGIYTGLAAFPFLLWAASYFETRRKIANRD